jgi:hypothetical protein
MPQLGHFAVQTTAAWDRCREQFAPKFTSDTKGIYYCIDKDDDVRVAAFILHTENVIGIDELGYEPTTFANCNKKFCMYIQPSKFWRETELNRSFFTILCRAAIGISGSVRYDPEANNYDHCMFMQPYFAGTKLATIRFLSGFTRFVPDTELGWPNRSGWYNVFNGKDVTQIRRQLLWPENRKSDGCLNSRVNSVVCV